MALSRAHGWLALLLVAGCAAPVSRAGAGAIEATPWPSLPPLEAAGASPYQAPKFDPLPEAGAAGRWVRLKSVPAPYPSPVVTPTPWPTVAPLPQDGLGYFDVVLPPDGLVLTVGQPTRIVGRFEVGAEPKDGTAVTWGVLEGDRADVAQDGTVTPRAPGPLHIYAEHDGQRYYLVAAVPDPGVSGVGAAPLRTVWMGSGGEAPWTTVIRSRAEWDEAVARQRASVSGLPSPPLPTDFDFSQHAIVMVSYYETTGDKTPVLTRIRQEDVPVAEVVLPHESGLLSLESVEEVACFFVTPALPANARVELVRYDHVQSQQWPPTGPTPTPTPAPTATPDPALSTDPAALPDGGMPAYEPPAFNPDPDACPPNTPGQPAAYLSWLALPVATSWEPVLEVGGTLSAYANSGTWHADDPRMADVTPEGAVTAKRAGAIALTVSNDRGKTRALLGAQDVPAPALRFAFKTGWDVPSAQAKRGPRVIHDATAWAAFWQGSLKFSKPRPDVDFTRYDVVALVDDRSTYRESGPVLTNVMDSGKSVHVVFPGFESQDTAYHQAVFLFLTGKLAADAEVHVHTLCNPAGL